MESKKRMSRNVSNQLVVFCVFLGIQMGCRGSGPREPATSQLQSAMTQRGSEKSSAPPGGDYIVGDPQSIKLFSQWSPYERSLMIISSDNGIYNTQNPMSPRAIPFLRVNPGSAKVEEYIQDFPISQDIHSQFKRLSNAISGDTCQNETLIPYHPDTKSQHHVIVNLKKNRELTEPKYGTYKELLGFTSMSRSLFVLNQSNSNGLPQLFSLKVGSDTVMGSHQPNKLDGVHWNAKYVNALSKTTSIHELAEESGIGLISDSVGLTYDYQYGVVLRDYSLLVNDKDYFFMPLMAFQEKLYNSPGVNGETYFWNLYKPAGAKISDKNRHILRLKLSSAQLKKVIDELAIEMGKLIAIYYLNGISSIDLHGQNLMVGIPLNPDRQAMIAVRDISDHWGFPYLPTSFYQLNYGAIPEPNWCQGLVKKDQDACSARAQNLTLKGFGDTANKLGFKFPQVDLRSFKNTKEIYELLLKQPDNYRQQITTVRHRFKPKATSMPIQSKLRAIRCLRSTGCPRVRAAAIP